MDQARSSLSHIFLTDDTARLRAGWRMAVHFLILTLMLTLVQLGVRALWPRSSDETLAQLRRILPVGLVFIFSIYLARRYVDKQSFKSLGLNLNRYVLGDFIFGFVLCVGNECCLFSISHGGLVNGRIMVVPIA